MEARKPSQNAGSQLQAPGSHCCSAGSPHALNAAVTEGKHQVNLLLSEPVSPTSLNKNYLIPSLARDLRTCLPG